MYIHFFNYNFNKIQITKIISNKIENQQSYVNFMKMPGLT